MQLSDIQREMLCEMTNSAYREIRQLAETGRLEQGFDLSAVFHNLLDKIWSDDFNLLEFRDEFLAGYQMKYHNSAARDYVVWVDRIMEIGNQRGGEPNTPAKTAPAP
jgi:hypothetical protein